MFGWFTRKKIKELDNRTQESFNSVKKDMDSVGKWLKHLNNKDKQLFEKIYLIEQELSTLRDEMSSLREGLEVVSDHGESKQLFKKLPVLDKQTAVEDVQRAVQTAVQTDNIYSILKKLSANERLLVLTLLNSEMKLSYEDIALLLGKERSTIRGQINSIKQKSEGLIEEISEKNGKKRVFIPEEIRKKMQKYVKVRVEKKKDSD
ncbi:MAG: hypothetical protein AABY10_06480 [Nanoarchaeota archaeon]